MSSILFTHSYFYRFDVKQWKTAQPYPPYGTMYAAALMRSLGYEVALFDTGLVASETEILPVLQKQKPKYLVIYDDGFNYLTKMCLTRMREAAFQMAQWGKEMECTVIVSSSDSTDHFEQYLQQGADFVLLGEGEMTLRELIHAIESGQADFDLIPGLAFLKHGKALRTAPRPVINQLDELPDPAWDLVDMEAYRQVWLRAHGQFTLNIATTRGCPYKCNWCAKPIYGNRYNSRSPERVAAEIELLIEQFGVRDFWMADDIFGLKPGWVQRFRDIVLQKNLKFTYKIQSRVDLLLKEDTIDALIASGLRQVWVGAESGSQKILDAMDKGTTVGEIFEATHLLKSKGVEVCFFLQFGYLGETATDIESTINMMETLLPHDIGVSVSYPLPGTKFYDKVHDLLGDKQNWTVSDDLALMYPSTFPAAYYKKLHRLVHKRFRLAQGKSAWQALKAGRPVQWRALFRMCYYAPAALIDTLMLKRIAHAA
ncbi:MAG: B12-binding domain-containing radical SAM protein [Saprospiraceae bacterium]|nr:B12-binding domain-containing radical SAM protein [Saprospiraceae bacterium]